jgi:hypothetical protein
VVFSIPEKNVWGLKKVVFSEGKWTDVAVTKKVKKKIKKKGVHGQNHTLVHIQIGARCASSPQRPRALGSPKTQVAGGQLKITLGESKSDDAKMDQATREQFFSICVTASLMLLAQTAVECAERSEFVGPNAAARVVIPPFVDKRFGTKVFKSRNKFERKNYRDNHWWRMIEERRHHDVRDRDGRDFRNNFRVPASFFDRMVSWYRDNGWTTREYDIFGQPSVPLELKILACFDMLGRGVCAATPAALIGCDETTIRTFFQTFCRRCTLHLSKIHIKFPSTVSEIRECVATYAEENINLPGCMGSVDCVHVPWPKALASQRSWYVGKEGFPTVAFQVVVNHKRKILSVSQPHPGSHNDKTIASMDPALHAIRTVQSFITYAWQAATAAGSATIYGVYLICDGGYHLWRILQRCNVVTSDPKVLFLMNRIVSARKDVECTFGVVKARFRILKYPLLCQELSDVRSVFTTCCIFHNILLEHDSGDFVDAGNLDGVSTAAVGRYRVTATSDFSGVASPPAGYWLGSHPEASHLLLRQTLANHLHWSHVNSASSLASQAGGTGRSD